ncbi:putative FAD dependent oxidoreductase [Rosellinia necatrix]|uniref:Putative FAD dependent oxidoreductase n=1 Tax=Rosellinia necatrix TaxID=77044 RepID=A0A1W2TV24_ROSNE|nr:putative FAD dependent oxidoreductase [Rosellinia necatrix]
MAHLVCPIPSVPGAGTAPAVPDISLAVGDEDKSTMPATDEVVNGEANRYKPPNSILIIGSGVFGLSTALSLTRRPEIPANTAITIVDRSPEPGVFPARDAASVDSSRIIRADYADAAYAKLAGEAQAHWRRGLDDPLSLGGGGRYRESGLLLAADAGGDGATVRGDGHPTGLGYTKRSWVNALALAHAEGRPLASVRLIPTSASIARASRTGGEWADWGYLNTAAGWADADGSMRWLYDRVTETGRVAFVNGTVETLETDGDGGDDGDPRVTGARLASGDSLSADLVIVAAGAWTPSLIDLSGQAVATGQCIAYLRLTDDEQAKLAQMPICLNLTDGCFAIPPRDGVLKMARHAYGYLNPQPVSHEPLGRRCRCPTPKDSNDDMGKEPSAASASTMTTATTTRISQPRTHLTDPTLSIPAEAASDLRRAMRRMFPWPELADRPFFQTRLCWYTDTATGDWIIDYHPTYKNLFVATGGSGHAFKFLPILGDKIVDCLVGRRPKDFHLKWKWKGGVGINGSSNATTTSTTTTTTTTTASTAGEETARGDGEDVQQQARIDAANDLAVELSIATEDGSRGGKPGLILQDEMVKSGMS